jgi:hypothetical protein
MTTLLLVAVIGVIAAAIATQLNKRKPEPPTQKPWVVPTQLDRNDFARVDAPWLVVAFTSSNCDACATVVPKAQLLESRDVAVSVCTYQTDKPTHERYGIDAVPTVVIADAQGVVQANFIGPVSATDLWAAVAELREPGSTPPPDAHTRI